MVAVAPSSSGIVAVMSASCTAPSLEPGASVFFDGELGSDDCLLDGEDSLCNKPMSERSERADSALSATQKVGFFPAKDRTRRRAGGGEICLTRKLVLGFARRRRGVVSSLHVLRILLLKHNAC